MADVSYDAVRIMQNITVKVKPTRTRELAWRLWLGARLFYFAAWVMNCNCEVEMRQR